MNQQEHTKQDLAEKVALVIEDEGEDGVYAARLVPVEEPALPAVGEAPAKPRRFALPSFSDGGQKRAFLNILRFLALVLVFTIIARGTSGATMPKITTASATRAEITQTISANATVQSTYTQPITLPGGVPIAQTLVVPGQKVEAGTPLFLLDAEKLQNQQQRQQLKLEEMQLNLKKLQRGEPYDSSGLIGEQNSYDWARQDRDMAAADNEKLVRDAQSAVDAAAEIQNARTALEELPADADAETRAAAQQRLDDANAALPGLESARNSAKEAEEDALLAADRDIERNRLALESAKTADQKARAEAADAAAQNKLDAKTLELDIADQEVLLATYTAAAADGHVYAGVSGTVLQAAQPGEVKEGEAAALISDDSGGFRAEGTLAKAEAAKLAGGAVATVLLPNSWDRQGTLGATVLSVGEADAEGQCRVMFKLPAGDWKQGQSVQVDVTQSREEYNAVVPLTAVHQSQNDYYLYVVESRSGILGVENVVRQVKVDLLARDNDRAAVSGAFNPEQKIVSQTSKPLADGDKVRLVQSLGDDQTI